MAIHLVVVENKSDWKSSFPSMDVITVKDYIAQQQYFAMKNARVINLCRSYRYLSRGYYCSLLAEARHHKVIPTVRTLRDLSSKAIYSLDIDSLDELLQDSLDKNPESDETVMLETYVLFGYCDKVALKKVARQIFATFPSPLMKVEFRRQRKEWLIYSIKSIHINTLPPEMDEVFSEALKNYTRKRWSGAKAPQISRYDLAILYNPDENLAPSDNEALAKFIKIGKELDVDVDLIKKKDYTRLAEYDALFIRETTNIDHYTYRFAKKAESEGMVVIDDPNSILRCTNKVYLAELLKANKIPTPKTVILQKDNLHHLEKELLYPVVLKIPDGSFCRGIYKATDFQEVLDISIQLFKDSDIILAQEYIYTPFDWRIGILNRKPMFACQYFMTAEHWQIVKHDKESGDHTEGTFRTFDVKEVPKKVIKTALKAADLIGNGLYGVDLKITSNGVYVIEVNDNPNLEENVENAVLKDDLYRIILKEFIRRINKKNKI